MVADSTLLGQLAEDFTRAIREARSPSIEEYAKRYPELAARIRDLFPTLLLLEGIAGSSPAIPPGSEFGHYRIVREIGRGGMGVVYEAVHSLLEKRVALKVLPPQAVPAARHLERFFREARTAAGLHHTNIVPVFDVGQASGIPYFAMQYIEGRSLEAVLSVAAAELTEQPSDYFRWVADIGIQVSLGLAYAHERKIIHRDIKPSNLLLDEKGVVWIADFGLARSVEDSGLTHTGILVGTPRYMSPEQVEPGNRPIDERSDIYSLGATLYELLTRRPAFEGTTPQEVMSQILGPEPASPRQVNPALPRDLETIVMKAMAKRPEDRYQSSEALAADLRRWLNLEPIRARRLGPAGRTIRWCRRNPNLAVVTAAAAMIILTLTGIYYRSLIRENAETRAALERERVQAETARETTEFLVELFQVADPGEARGNTITAREILDRGSQRITSGLKDQPVVQATLMDTLGKVYGSLGLYKQARQLLESALEKRKQHFGSQSPEVADSLCSLAALMQLSEKREDARAADPPARESLRIRRMLLPPDALEIADSLYVVANGMIFFDRASPEAAKLFNEALAIQRKRLGKKHPSVARTLASYGLLLTWGQLAPYEAEPLLAEALEIRREALGEEHPDTLSSMESLAMNHAHRGKYQSAESLYRSLIASMKTVLKNDHPKLIHPTANLALLLSRDEADLRDAEKLLHDALAVIGESMESAPDKAWILGGLAEVKRKLGNYTEAELLYREAMMSARLPPREPIIEAGTLDAAGRFMEEMGHTARAESLYRQSASVPQEAFMRHIRARAVYHLGALLARLGRHKEANTAYREAITIQEGVYGDHRGLTPFARADVEAVQAGCLKGLGRFSEAEALFMRSHPVLESYYGARHSRTVYTLREMIDLYEKWGKREKAAEWRARLPRPPRPTTPQAPE